MQGTFGAERFELDPISARELEGFLLEMCYQRQLFPSNHTPTTFARALQSTSQGKWYDAVNDSADQRA